MKRPPSFIYDLFAWCFKVVLLFIGYTSKVKVFHIEYYQQYQSQGKPVVFAFWHENLIPPIFFYYSSLKGKRLVSMVSRSGDGEIIARVLEAFRGMTTVRGSSSRGGATALKEIAEKMKQEGRDAAMVPDGPKGPPYSVQPGVLKLSQLSLAPILVCGVAVKRKKRIGSWDRMKIPAPFNRMALAFGTPFYVPVEVTDLTPYEARLKQEIAQATQEAEKFLTER